ncbi:hypothetical protein [Streptomyces sp. NBC_01506]|uniref:hypothetical protein n=1 Tax=Streptomyces sp. NBC_01506 TaxID=2903887 RepID=UPI00386FE3BF
MIVSYKSPEGGAEQVETDDLSAKESADIEVVTELEWTDVEDALRRQKPTAMRAVLWIFRRRATPGLLFSQCDVPGWKRRLTAKMNTDETRDWIDALRTSHGEDSEEFADLMSAVRIAAHESVDVDKALAKPGKAPAPVGPEESGGSSSSTAG